MTKYSQPDSLLETVLQVNMSRSRLKNSEPDRILGPEMPVFQWSTVQQDHVMMLLLIVG